VVYHPRYFQALRADDPAAESDDEGEGVAWMQELSERVRPRLPRTVKVGS
jgi:hypothetical protein